MSPVKLLVRGPFSGLTAPEISARTRSWGSRGVGGAKSVVRALSALVPGKLPHAGGKPATAVRQQAGHDCLAEVGALALPPPTGRARVNDRGACYRTLRLPW
jgi:hypothetical protein